MSPGTRTLYGGDNPLTLGGVLITHIHVFAKLLQMVHLSCTFEGWGMAQFVMCLLCKHKGLGSIPGIHILKCWHGVWVPSTAEVETRGSLGLGGQPS